MQDLVGRPSFSDVNSVPPETHTNADISCYVHAVRNRFTSTLQF